MKDEAAIQRAHDILHFLTSGECEPFLNRDGAIAASAAHDALSWILGFPCGESFQTNLDGIFDELMRRGYQEIDMGRPVLPEKENG